MAFGGRDEIAGETLDVLGCDLEVVAGLGDVVDGLGVEGLSLLECQEASHLVDPVLPQVVDPKAQLGPLEGRPLTHFVCCLPGGGHRSVEIGLRRLRDRVDVIAGHRRSNLVCLAARALGPFAGDEEFEISGHVVMVGLVP